MSVGKSWFDHTFASRQSTEQLLRPDLESGLLSQHDFDLAVAFLPGYHRYLPYVHSVLWGAAAGYGLYRFKPKIPFPTTIVGVSAVSGYGFGLVHYFHEHRNFARQLEDRQAFLLVLENVNKRLGNPNRLFPQLDNNRILERIMKRKQESGEYLAPGVELVGDSSTESLAMTDGSTPAPKATEDASSSRPKSVWEAIREANAQNTGKRSSWDELRQRYERERVSERVHVQSQGSTPSDLEDPRVTAQAEFDAILEAERKAARG
ncbi:hypothetical protein K466DRAFT_643771 [Polyporus arcularius HHB13444]|uniref:Uncharacterized protein n=1 Tax=Polyporus arcularius HHB13444 TaxID=1314778 RepID=A0A5C3PQG7_9APHY|nr:hypothetical protein K466DRAFT_643771 [Polyporus arcularius HHB13444]